MATYSINYEPEETYIKFVCPECGFSDYTDGEPVCTRCEFEGKSQAQGERETVSCR